MFILLGCRAYAPEHCVTTKGIKTLARLPHLRELKMSYLADISDEALIVLAQNGTLHKLECRGCPSLKGDGFLRFVLFPFIKYIGLLNSSIQKKINIYLHSLFQNHITVFKFRAM